MVCESWSIRKKNKVKKYLKHYKSEGRLIERYEAFVEKIRNAGSTNPARFSHEMLTGIRTPEGLPVYSRRMGGGMRLTFSVHYDTCTVTIRSIGDHKVAYG